MAQNPNNLGNAISQAEAVVGEAEQVIDEGGFDIPAVAGADGQFVDEGRFDIPAGVGSSISQAGQALGSADLDAVTDFTLDSADADLSTGITGQKGCRLERRDNSEGTLPGECFREPECNEVCEASDGEDCTISDEVVCRTVSDPVSRCQHITSFQLQCEKSQP